MIRRLMWIWCRGQLGLRLGRSGGAAGFRAGPSLPALRRLSCSCDLPSWECSASPGLPASQWMQEALSHATPETAAAAADCRCEHDLHPGSSSSRYRLRRFHMLLSTCVGGRWEAAGQLLRITVVDVTSNTLVYLPYNRRGGAFTCSPKVQRWQGETAELSCGCKLPWWT